MRALVLQIARRAYSGSLFLYAPELRRRYGQEMLLVFMNEMEEAMACSVAAASRVAVDAFAETFSVALPGLVADSSLVAPLASVVLTPVVYAALVWALQNPLRLNSMYHAFVRICSP